MKIFRWEILLMPLLLTAAEPTVDRYGQFPGENWPGKITSDAELRADAERETPELAAVDLNDPKIDRYGGVRACPAGKATGFFRVEKRDGRWWIVSPEGNLFFFKGVDATHFDAGYASPLDEQDGSPRRVFQELPDPALFPEAYPAKRSVNFLAANLRRKYGPEFRRRYEDVTERRLRSWGFNANGKWASPRFGADRLPYISDSGIRGGRSMGRARDPFDPDFARLAEEQLSPRLKQLRNDPWLLAWAFENENDWNRNTVGEICNDTTGTLPAKRALLEMIAAGGGGDPGAQFGLPGIPLDALMSRKLDSRKIPQATADAFVREASRRYHGTLAALVRKYDPNHLMMLNSHTSAGVRPWLEGACEFVDIFPVHDYDLTSGWLENTLRPILQRYDKPFAVVEFSFVRAARGLSFYRPYAVVSGERERGLAYRRFTERWAADPLCVGFSWFVLYDQAVTKRSVPNGECHNFGMIDVCDRPYREMLAEVTAANHRLFDVHRGTVTPTLPAVRSLGEQLRAEFLPDSTGGGFLFDAPESFPGAPVRIRPDNSGKEPTRIGIIDSGAAGGFQKLVFQVWAWNNVAPDQLDRCFLLEESPDNHCFTPVSCVFQPARSGKNFSAFQMHPSNLKPDTRYVRFSLAAPVPGKTWAVQFAGAEVDRRK